MITEPNVPPPLSIRTHVRYHVGSHQFFNIKPRPTGLTLTQVSYQSGWIKVQDWDDFEVHALVDGDIHVTFESRGFVQV